MSLENEDIRQKIKPLRLELGLTQEDLASRVGVTRAAISQWENSTTGGIDLANATRLSEALGLSLSEMQGCSVEVLLAKTHMRGGNIRLKRGGQRVLRAIDGSDKTLARREINAPDTLADRDIVVVPSVDTVVVGGFDAADKEAEVAYGVPVLKHWLIERGLVAESLCAARIHDSSMEPTLMHGDIVIADESDTIPSRYSRLYLVAVDDVVTVRRLATKITKEGVAELILSADSQNKIAYQDYDIPMGTLDIIFGMRIVGRVVWSISRL